jgi:hypothetical protein
VAVGGGFLQSLVDATPSRIGQTYLCLLYDEVHDIEELHGKALYYTPIVLSEACMEDLAWWKHFLVKNPGNFSRNGTAGNIMGTWGDGSGTGTGGTVEPLGQTGLPRLEAWMGAWNPWVYRFSSNWKELRTLLWTLERLEESDEHRLKGVTLFYFTDNMTTYYVVQNGSSKSPELHRLIRSIKWHEIRLGCRVEVIHVPGDLMIEEGTDGLSRGIWLSPERIYRSSLTEACLALGQVQFTTALGQWVLDLMGLSPYEQYSLQCSTSRWSFKDIFRQVFIWIPTPEIA